MSGAPGKLDVDAVDREGFGLSDELPPFDSEWHQHRYHQLLYATAGTMQVVTAEVTWTLPALRAGWIPAGTPHRVRSQHGLSLRTVYLSPKLSADRTLGSLGVFDATPLGRELVAAAMAEGPTHPPSPTAGPLFRALAAFCAEWLSSPLALNLPAAKSDELAAATSLVHAHLGEALTVPSLAKKVGTSARTLERRFKDELAMGFRDYLRAARMQRAIELLAERRHRVKTVAALVGFSSEASFTRAFAETFDETPTGYLARLKRA